MDISFNQTSTITLSDENLGNDPTDRLNPLHSYEECLLIFRRMPYREEYRLIFLTFLFCNAFMYRPTLVC